MGSQTHELKLPFIDFSNLDENKKDQTWDSRKSQVYHALEEFGCFEASFDNIPLELHTSMFDSLEQLFDLPLQTKLKNYSPKPFHGYVGEFPILPLYESMGIDAATIAHNVESFTKTLWPEGNPKFSKLVEEFSVKLSKLDQMVRVMVLESLGLEKYIEEHMGSTYYLLKFLKYKGPETHESKVGLTSHTDKNLVSILHQYQVDGLEVQTKFGDWIKIKPSPNSFIIISGDVLYAWTNGRVHSPYHRVMMSGKKTRYSVGLFSIPNGGYVIKAPAEVVDEEHPLIFKPFDHAEFLLFYYTEAGRQAESALKTYCGV